MTFRRGVFEGGRFLPTVFPVTQLLSASGAVQAQNATGSGLASYETAASGNAQAPNATASGIALIELTASGAVQAQNATASGSAAVPTDDRTASGAVQAQNATALGSAFLETIATGSAQAQSATTTGSAFIETFASGSPQAQNATASGSGVAETIASGSVQAQNATASGVAIVGVTLASLPVGAVPVYLEAGQSNSEGDEVFANPGGISSTQTFFKADPNSTANDGSFALLQHGVNINNPETTPAHNQADPTIYVARTVEANYPSVSLKVVQHAEGGTGFQSGTGRWAASGDLRRELIHHYLKPALSTLVGQGDTPYLFPFTWIQGERDATNATDAGNYQSELTAFAAAVRSEIGASLRLAVVQLNNSIDPTGYPNSGTVRTAQQNFAGLSADNSLIDIDDIAMSADNVHYTAAGCEAIANRIFSQYETVELTEYVDAGVEITNAPTVSSIGADSISVAATTGEYATLYVGAWADGTTQPSNAAIKAGTGAVSHASQALIYDAEGTAVINSLPAATYDLFYVLEDLAGNQQSGAIADVVVAPSGPTLIHQSTFTGPGGSASTLANDDYTPEQGTMTFVAGNFFYGLGSPPVSITTQNDSVGGSGKVITVGPSSSSSVTEVILRLTANESIITKTYGVILRYIDDSNYVAIFIKREATDTIRLFERTAGTFSSVATQNAGSEIAQGTVVDLEVAYSSSRVRAVLKNTGGTSLAPVIDVANSTHNTSDTAGIRVGNDAVISLNDLEVYSRSDFPT